MIRELMGLLSADTDLEAQMETLARLNDLNRTRTMLNNELGRV